MRILHSASAGRPCKSAEYVLSSTLFNTQNFLLEYHGSKFIYNYLHGLVNRVWPGEETICILTRFISRIELE